MRRHSRGSLAGCQAPELSQFHGQGCAPDRLARSSESHLATVPICTETPSTLTHPAANTCAGLLAALCCATSGPLLVESPASMLCAVPVWQTAVPLRQPFVVAFGAALSGVCLHRYYILTWTVITSILDLHSSQFVRLLLFSTAILLPTLSELVVKWLLSELEYKLLKTSPKPCEFCLASWSGALTQIWMRTYFEADLLWARGLSRWLPEDNRREGPSLTSISALKQTYPYEWTPGWKRQHGFTPVVDSAASTWYVCLHLDKQIQTHMPVLQELWPSK